MRDKLINLKINGKKYQITVKSNTLLLNLLRELGYTDPKYGCGIGECGACSVLLDGQLTLSCLTLAISCDNKEVITAAGLSEKDQLHPLAQSLIEHAAIQCGFCTPGMIIAGKSLLDKNPNPTEEDVRQYLRGNLCRCTGYTPIVEAVLDQVRKSKS
ncbi:MAG: (2Fe-2S)-binding protein [Coprothermobacterota bacterium]|nr:(2Fe-2S)-binding protein [Coprothermobacterota bacterium]